MCSKIDFAVGYVTQNTIKKLLSATIKYFSFLDLDSHGCENCYDKDNLLNDQLNKHI